MESRVKPEEVARGVLPWILMGKFKNVITSLGFAPSQPGTYEVRSVEYYVSPTARTVHVPAASSLLYVPLIEFTVDVLSDKKSIVVREVDGKVVGRFFDGTPKAYSIRNIEEELRRKGKQTEIKYEEEPSRFDVDFVLRRFYRFMAGRLFAANLISYSKKYGITFKNLGLMKKLQVYIEGYKTYIPVDVVTSLYGVSYSGMSFTSPGVVPGLVKIVSDGAVGVQGEAADVLKDVLKRLSTVGERLSPVSGGLLQSTNKSRFTYVVGELSGSHKNDRLVLSWGRYKGVEVGFYGNPGDGTIEMSVTVHPFNPPGIIVLNYPPLNLAPLSGVLKDCYWFVEKLSKRALYTAGRHKLSGTIYLRELTPLTDTGVSILDVKKLLREGYPRVETINKMLDGFEKIGRIGDLLSLTIGKVEKVDKLLVTYLGEGKSKKARKEEEEEEEVVTL